MMKVIQEYWLAGLGCQARAGLVNTGHTGTLIIIANHSTLYHCSSGVNLSSKNSSKNYDNNDDKKTY